MKTVKVGTAKIKHDGCYQEEVDDVQIGYRCAVCCAFIHKKSDRFKVKVDVVIGK